MPIQTEKQAKSLDLDSMFRYQTQTTQQMNPKLNRYA